MIRAISHGPETTISLAVADRVTPLPDGAIFADLAEPMMRHERADQIAVEHVGWCRRQGLGRDEICHDVGIDPATVHSWDDLTQLVAALWIDEQSDE